MNEILTVIKKLFYPDAIIFAFCITAYIGLLTLLFCKKINEK